MALTDTQKTQIRRYLGYADRDSGLYSALEGPMNDQTTEAETEIGVILTDLTTIETTIRSSWSRQKVLKVEDVILAGREEIGALRWEGNRLARMLAIILGIAIRHRPFESGSSWGVARRG